MDKPKFTRDLVVDCYCGYTARLGLYVNETLLLDGRIVTTIMTYTNVEPTHEQLQQILDVGPNHFDYLAWAERSNNYHA